MTQIILSIPNNEVSFISMLAKKMGWSIETKENLLDRFIKSCPENSPITDDEIQQEVKAVRNR